MHLYVTIEVDTYMYILACLGTAVPSYHLLPGTTVPGCLLANEVSWDSCTKLPNLCSGTTVPGCLLANEVSWDSCTKLPTC